MNNLLMNWGFARLFRLVAGLGIGVFAVVGKEYLLLWVAGFFLLQALFNVSCCGAGNCGGNTSKQVYRDEIKTYKPTKK